MRNKKHRDSFNEKASEKKRKESLSSFFKAFAPSLEGVEDLDRFTGEDLSFLEEDFDPQVLQSTGVKFKNIGGIKEIKQELGRIVDFLREPRRHKRMGARLPKGILIQGPSGTGKTMLAKALAQESGMPSIHVSGAQFDELAAGEGAERIRTLLNKAREVVEKARENGNQDAACLICIDDIDIIAESRLDKEDTHQSVMRELLYLMDEFSPDEGITIIGTTNRPEVIDPDFERAGRFDVSVDVVAPDAKGRTEILDILVKDRGVPLKVDVNLEDIAHKLYGFSGADLSVLVNHAAMIAASNPKARKVGMDDFREAYDRLLKGPRTHLKIKAQEKESTAVHEAGHAIIGLLTEKDGMDMLRSVTILPHTGSLGTTYFDDDDERYSRAYRSFYADLMVTYGGRIAEELVYGPENVSSGAWGDFEIATEIARNMVMVFGFNEELGCLNYSNGFHNMTMNVESLDPETGKKLNEEIIALTNRAYKQAREILAEHYGALLDLAQDLVEKETLDREEVIEITSIRPEKFVLPALKDIARTPDFSYIQKPDGTGSGPSPS